MQNDFYSSCSPLHQAPRSQRHDDRVGTGKPQRLPLSCPPCAYNSSLTPHPAPRQDITVDLQMWIGAVAGLPSEPWVEVHHHEEELHPPTTWHPQKFLTRLAYLREVHLVRPAGPAQGTVV